MPPSSARERSCSWTPQALRCAAAGGAQGERLARVEDSCKSARQGTAALQVPTHRAPADSCRPAQRAQSHVWEYRRDEEAVGGEDGDADAIDIDGGGESPTTQLTHPTDVELPPLPPRCHGPPGGLVAEEAPDAGHRGVRRQLPGGICALAQNARTGVPLARCATPAQRPTPRRTRQNCCLCAALAGRGAQPATVEALTPFCALSRTQTPSPRLQSASASRRQATDAGRGRRLGAPRPPRRPKPSQLKSLSTALAVRRSPQASTRRLNRCPYRRPL